MPDEPSPLVVDGLLRIVQYPQMIRHDIAALGRIGQLFAAPVKAFQLRMGRIASRTVYIHKQLAVVNRQFGMGLEWHIILKQAVRRSYNQFYRTITFHVAEQIAHRTRQRGTTPISTLLRRSRSIIPINCSDPALAGSSDQLFTPRQITRRIPTVTTSIECSQQTGTVDATPQPDLKG